MAPLDVAEGQVRRLIADVAPLVSHLTGWNLRTGDLGARVLAKAGSNEEIVRRRLKSAGIAPPPRQAGGFYERLMERLVEESILAAYDHGGQEILVVRENVEGADLDGLRLVLAHELVHRGQHVRHRDLFDRADALLRAIYLAAGPDGAAADGAGAPVAPLEAIMTLLESHARYVEEEVKRLYLPRATLRSGFDMMVFLLQALAPGKGRQYTDGLPAVAAAAGNGTVDSLYESLI